MKSKNNIAIILPAFNEENTIRDTILSFHAVMPDANIWVINNNSTDQTSLIAQKAFKQNNINGFVLNESKQGKGFAVAKAFSQIEADVYVMCDADSTYPAAEVTNLIKPVINDEADIVVGDRISNGSYVNQNRRTFHSFGNRLVKGLINLLFKSNLNDIMSGYRVFSRKFVKNYPILVGGFEIETDMTIFALDRKYKIIELPIIYSDRPEGSFSKLNTFWDGLKVLKTIFNMFRHYKPLAFFSFASVIMFLFGFLFGYIVIIDYLDDSFISRVPLAILTGVFILSGIVSLGIGLILDSIHYHHKQFENQHQKK